MYLSRFKVAKSHANRPDWEWGTSANMTWVSKNWKIIFRNTQTFKVTFICRRLSLNRVCSIKAVSSPTRCWQRVRSCRQESFQSNLEILDTETESSRSRRELCLAKQVECSSRCRGCTDCQNLKEKTSNTFKRRKNYNITFKKPLRKSNIKYI